MTDDRLHRWLEVADAPQRPDPRFAASLLEDLGAELGFTRAPRVPRVGTTGVRHYPRTASSRRRLLELLLVAAFVVAATAGLIAAAGAIRDRNAPPPPLSLLTEIRQAGRIRIAIRPDHPQYTIGGQAAAGFDVDVAREIARRLGVAPELVIEDAGTMVASDASTDWDVGLPSLPVWSVDPSTFLTSTPYYRWPHRLVVPVTSSAAATQDVAAGPICAVAGDAGESWLRGSDKGVSSAPITTSITTRATDADCLSAMSTGAAVAAVTANLSNADLQVRADVRVIGGPAAEPRAVIVRRAQGSAGESGDLLRAIDEALAAMGADGTLTRLSQSRFGGADLTTP